MATITNIGDLVEGLKRELATPGDFETFFPNADDDGLFASLSDALAEAQLDGFFSTTTWDLITGDLTPEMSMGEGALLVLYAGIRILLAKLRQTNLSAGQRYKAGPVEFETSVSATYLTAELKALEERKKYLLRLSLSGNDVFFGDGYLSRMYNNWSDGGCVTEGHLY